MGKCCSRGRVGKVVGRHVDSLHRSNRTLLCRGDAFLQLTHFLCQVRLVSHSRWQSAKRAETSAPAWVKRKMLSMKNNTSLPLSRKPSAMVKTDKPRANGRRAVRSSGRRPAKSFQHAGFFHFVVQVIAFTGTLTDAGENRLPLWNLAMLFISSWIKTVLPTPAPPNRPTLPPLVIGAIRSMTLIPVSRISTVPDCSASAGG